MTNQVVSVKGIPCLYCYHYKDGGRRYFVKTQCQCRVLTQNIAVHGTITHRELKRITALAVRELKDSILKPKQLHDYIEEYIIVRQLKTKTAKAYRRILKNYTLDPAHNTMELAKTMQSGINVCQTTRAVKSFFNWLNQNGIAIANPAANIKLPQSRIRHRTLTRKEIHLFYKKLSECSPEVELYGRLLLETGARVSSIHAICRSDLTSKGLYLHNIKCGRDYALPIPLSQETLELWRRYIRTQPESPNGRLFTTGFSMLNRYLHDLLNQNFNRNTGERVVIHTLRHTAATVALQNGVPIDMVCRMLDHVNVQTTMSIYAKVSQKQMNKAYQKLFDSLEK